MVPEALVVWDWVFLGASRSSTTAIQFRSRYAYSCCGTAVRGVARHRTNNNKELLLYTV